MTKMKSTFYCLLIITGFNLYLVFHHRKNSEVNRSEGDAIYEWFNLIEQNPLLRNHLFVVEPSLLVGQLSRSQWHQLEWRYDLSEVRTQHQFKPNSISMGVFGDQAESILVSTLTSLNSTITAVRFSYSWWTG